MSALKSSLARALRSSTSNITTTTTHAPTRTAVDATSRLVNHVTRQNSSRSVASLGWTDSLPVPPVLSIQDLHRPLYQQPSPLPSPSKTTPFDTLLNNITTHLTSLPPTSLNPQIPYLHALLRSYASTPTHWSRYAHANPSKQYTRNLVASVEGVFNLLLLVWTPGQKSPVHDHADAHCLMKILKGDLVETRFAIPERPGCQGALVQTSRRGFGQDGVSYMADSLGLHSISNPHPTEYAVSLHLYTPPHAATRGCHVYDEHDGAARLVQQNSYDSVGGVVCQTP